MRDLSVTRDCDTIIRIEVGARGVDARQALMSFAADSQRIARCDESDVMRKHDPAIARRAQRRYEAAAWALRMMAR